MPQKVRFLMGKGLFLRVSRYCLINCKKNYPVDPRRFTRIFYAKTAGTTQGGWVAFNEKGSLTGIREPRSLNWVDEYRTVSRDQGSCRKNLSQRTAPCFLLPRVPLHRRSFVLPSMQERAIIICKHLRCGQLLAARSLEVRGSQVRNPDLGHPATCGGANCSLFARLGFVVYQGSKAKPGAPGHLRWG